MISFKKNSKNVVKSIPLSLDEWRAIKKIGDVAFGEDEDCDAVDISKIETGDEVFFRSGTEWVKVESISLGGFSGKEYLVSFKVKIGGVDQSFITWFLNSGQCRNDCATNRCFDIVKVRKCHEGP